MQLVNSAWAIAFFTSMLSLQLQAAAVDDFQTKYNTLQKNLEKTADNVLKTMDTETDDVSHEYNLKRWNYRNHFNPENMQERIDSAVKYSQWEKQSRQQAEAWNELSTDFSDSNLRRQFKLMSTPKFIDLPDNDMARYFELLSEMEYDYNTKTICVDFECGARLQPDIEEQFRETRDYEQLERMWLTWRSDLGRTFRDNYREFVNLSNAGAKNLEYKDRGQMGRVPYETGNLKGDVTKVYNNINNLYKELQAYLRFKLRERYGSENIKAKGPIPEHIVSNMVGNDWSNSYEITRPFPNQPSLEATDKMREMQFDGQQVYRLADRFYQSLGLEKLPENYWRNSVFSRTPGKDMSCESETFEISYKQNFNDFRTKSCANPSFEQYMEAMENIGRYHYAAKYKEQPSVFKIPANPGFEDLVGKTLSLSASTPEQLQADRLIESGSMNGEQSMNYLYKQALRILPRMMNGYMTERFRWDMFEGKVPFDSLNCDWVKKRYEIMGVKPSKLRTEEDFDPAANLDTLTEEDNVKDFVSGVLQFQLYRHLCETAGKYTKGSSQQQLHQCNFFNSKQAGEKLTTLMQAGASRPWKETLRMTTGESEMSGEALMEYFEPLMGWLSKENQKNSEFVGWEKDGEYCSAEPFSPKSRSDVACTYIRTPNGIKCV